MLSPHDGGAAGGRGGTWAKRQSSASASQDPLLETSGGLLSTEQLIQLVCKWMAISLPSCVTWQFCFLWFHGHRDTHPTRWQQSWSLILALSQFPGTCCMWWALWDHRGSDLHLPHLQSPGSVLMHIKKHQSQFCSWFYAQMRKDSCPATSEGPVQPYVSVHGVPEGCPPAP